MNKEILLHDVQDFLKSSVKENPKDIALRKSQFANVSSSELATQLESRQRAKKKLPLWFQSSGIYFPSSLSIEQASSEETALYKARLIQENTSLIDLTGGIGVDSYYFSKRAKKVVHCELSPDLSKIAKHNAEVLGAKNIEFFEEDGVEFLKQQSKDSFQIIYLDPSRRVKTRKVFMLNDCEPNVIELFQDLLEKASTVIIKTAPLLDISLTLTELMHVKEVHIISIKNECKEVLFILKRDFTNEPTIKVAGLGKDSSFDFHFLQKEEKNAVADYSLPQNYLFDPDVALLKAGCFKLLSQRYAIQKIHPNTHLYTSKNQLDDWPGRSFKIKETYEYKDFKKKKKDWNANVISRNFPLKVEELRKKHRIAESTMEYLFFCKGIDEKLYVIHVDRLA
jgi:16S rRNA G966 N2-methylase RsmD